jgi:hypothetical protein
MNIELTDREASIVVHALVRFTADDDHPDAPAAGDLAVRIGREAGNARRLVESLAHRAGDWDQAAEARAELDAWRFGERGRGS